MTTDEKSLLIRLFEDGRNWCRGAEAIDTTGAAVCYDDERAVAWDLTGALCRLFGWPRACALFGQLDRYIRGKRRAVFWQPRTEMDGLAFLQEFNDRPDTTFALIRQRLESVPIYEKRRRTNDQQEKVTPPNGPLGSELNLSTDNDRTDAVDPRLELISLVVERQIT